MTLEEHVNTLSKKKQIALAIQLAYLALPIWEDFCVQGELSYRDTVVGMHHQVHPGILKRGIMAVERYHSFSWWSRILDGKKSIMNAAHHFDDPVVALQDTDWELPEHVECVFYSVYNLLEYSLGKLVSYSNESIIYISINQSADALLSSEILSRDQLCRIIYNE